MRYKQQLEDTDCVCLCVCVCSYHVECNESLHIFSSLTPLSSLSLKPNIWMLYWHHRWTLFPKHLLSLCVSLSVSVGVSHPVRSNSTVKVDLLTCWAPPTSCQSLLCGFVLCVSLCWHCYLILSSKSYTVLLSLDLNWKLRQSFRIFVLNMLCLNKVIVSWELPSMLSDLSWDKIPEPCSPCEIQKTQILCWSHYCTTTCGPIYGPEQRPGATSPNCRQTAAASSVTQ